MKTWYAKNSAGNHQGLVIDEQTGANIAVAYDIADAPLLAAAPELLEACQYAKGVLLECGSDGAFTQANALQIIDKLGAAIRKAGAQ